MRYGLLFLLIASAPLLALAYAWRDRPLDQDAPQYFALAKSWAAGAGYTNPLSPWPNAPTCERMPGWPAIVAGVLWILPHAWEGPAVIRFTGAVFLALAGLKMTYLCQRLGVRSEAVRFMAGLAVAWSPPLVFIAVSGMSEVSFLALVLLGIVGLTRPAGPAWWGALSLGLAITIRTNFILIAPIFLALLVFLPHASRRVASVVSLPQGALLLVLFLLPITGWVVRNQRVTGVFPVLAAIEGETFRGSHNDVVAFNPQYWGSWVMPDEIPGESKKFDLARAMTDLEVSEHYKAEGWKWIGENRADLPMLLIGKLVRGFLPIPWNPQLATYVAFTYRGLLIIAFFIMLPFWGGRVDRLYIAFLASTYAVVLITTLLFYGNYRFTHCMGEVFFIPCIAMALDMLFVIPQRETA